jgi:hypothetical protein
MIEYGKIIRCLKIIRYREIIRIIRNRQIVEYRKIICTETFQLNHDTIN